MKHNIAPNTVCSVIFNGYRLELKQTATGETEYWFYDGSFLEEKYQAPEYMKNAVSMMGHALMVALDDFEKKGERTVFNKMILNNQYGKAHSPKPNNYIIDFSEIQNAYTISNRGAIVDSGEGHQLFSMMARIQQNDLAQNRRSTFQIRTNSIYTDIGGISQ